jgi:crotonobetainyl-CoA:carnitine CoA-transferase CaiB-like acyl-CoA transferase
MTATDRVFRVLDLTTTLAGAYAAHLLSSGGVDVTRVDPPGGHALRRWSATGASIPDGGSGPLFQWLAGGQAAVTVDPAAPADVDELLAWAATFDVVLSSRDAVVDIAALAAAAPDATVISITPFGLDGPWADHAATEFTLQALSGGPALRGSRAWPPMSSGGQHGEYMQGVFGAVAAMIALRREVVTGGGGVVDVSGLESVMMTQLFNPATMETQVDGVRPKRYKATVADVVASADGYVGFAVVNRVQHWMDFCSMIGRQDWADDRSLDPVPARTDRSDELNPVIKAWTTAHTTAEIVELATLMRIPCIEVGNGESIPQMDHFASEAFYDVNPDGGFLQPAAPFRMHPPIPDVAVVATAPPIGPSITAIERPAGPSPLGPTAPAGTRPFEGIRVADFTSFWAGPFFAHTLGMFGADVIHIESTGRPDGARLMNHHPRSTRQWWERSPYFHATNTNKRGVTIDMSVAEGRDLARRLIAECDVMVENYSPRVMESFGLSWDEVREINPGLIMVRMPAFGLTGPWRDRTGFAMTMEQVSGMAWLTGFPEHDPGALFGPCDPGAGLHALIGLFVALEHRRRTGEGRLVECPMVANALNVAGEQVIEFSANGVRLERMGNRGLAAAPQNSYAAADWDDDLDQHRWVSIAVATDTQWDALRSALGDPVWARDPELATAVGRRARHDELDAEIGAWCAARTSTEIVDALWPAGVPVAVVVHPSAHLAFDQLLHREFFEHVEHPVHGDSVHITYPFRLPGDAGPVHLRPAPLLGQHNAEIFGDLLGLTPADLDALAAAGVIGTAVPD